MRSRGVATRLHAVYSEHIRKMRLVVRQLVRNERILLPVRRAGVLKKEANHVRIHLT